MRVGLIAAVHGNAHALDAVLGAMRHAGVDAMLCAGDLVGYYYEPGRCLDLLDAYPLTAAVRGNHEDMLATRLCSPDTAASQIARFGHGLEIAATELSSARQQWLTTLPVTTRVTIGGTSVLLCHGSPWSTDEYVYPEDPIEKLERCAEAGDPFVILGHTHCPGAWRVGDTWIVNPGSVGQPRRGTGGAEWALLDLSTGAVRHHAVPYDTSPVVARARATDSHFPFLWQVLEHA